MMNGHDDIPTKISIDDRDGKVIWQFSQPTSSLALDPQNAFEIAEATAKAAHRAKFGESPQSDRSYIAEQVRARITEDLRDRMVTRAVLMMRSMVRQERDPDYIARQLVDTIFSEVGTA
jgi:hypothetical protein